MISPMILFLALVAGTLATFAARMLADKVHRRQLINLAREWQMHYAPDDRFQLAPRVAERLPTPGAADICVVDLIYGTEQGVRRYVFCAHYTTGVVRRKTRGKCVASLCEAPNREGGDWSGLVIAPRELSMVEQYRDASKRAQLPEKVGA
jgi:hypothetical protein